MSPAQSCWPNNMMSCTQCMKKLFIQKNSIRGNIELVCTKSSKLGSAKPNSTNESTLLDGMANHRQAEIKYKTIDPFYDLLRSERIAVSRKMNRLWQFSIYFWLQFQFITDKHTKPFATWEVNFCFKWEGNYLWRLFKKYLLEQSLLEGVLVVVWVVGPEQTNYIWENRTFTWFIWFIQSTCILIKI